MYKLSDAQIDFILGDIGARGVETEDLQLNLLDHICCIIEREFEEKEDFGQFYQKIISRFFKKELKELEEETQLLLTFKHYYTMKKTMFISGFFSAFLMLFGGYFKLMHWPGANIMLILGMGIFSLIFLPLTFTLRLREKTERRDKVVLLLGLFTAVYFLVGALFKFMHWPGAGFFVLTGIPFLLFVFLPVYLVNGLKNPTTKVNTIVTAILIIAGSGFVMVLPSKSNVYNVLAKYSYLKNEEISLQELQAMVPDSSGTSRFAAWKEFMKSADAFKNAIVRVAAEVDYQTYIDFKDVWGSEAIGPDQLRKYPEMLTFIDKLVKFESVANKEVYEYPGYLEFKATDRSSEIDYILISNPNVKDVLSTIINTQEQACLAMLKR